ncbi:MAG: FAD-dependent oxidoreductase [Planctomycetota bacterium]
MLRLDEQPDRDLHTEEIDADLVIVGGGMAGSCAAIAAARQGLQVVLVQDRPVLGGNASSEVRLWMVGATSHMGNNNRWAREGGVLNEILMENIFRNPEGNPILFDTVVLEKVTSEPTITLLLNTAVHEVHRRESNRITSLMAFCSQNSTRYLLRAPLFCDSSGDGIVGFLAGAAFRIGVESHSEFGELLAPTEESVDLLGHSIYFYTRDVGHPVQYVPPAYALDDITKIPRFRRFNTKEQGTDLWWIEYGGSRDTVHDTETIKWELWKVIYGVWNHVKNSGEFPDAESLTLDWVGLIPGKRESRRFEGDYMLVQQDLVEQRVHDDAVSVGGWAIDHHPVDNVYSESEPCTQWHSKGVYQIPYRTMYSRNVPNLFLAGRIISASHVAFGSSRVMATCAHNGQAVGMAAALCHERGLQPRDIVRSQHMRELQLRLLREGQHIPLVKRDDTQDLAQLATVTASSSFRKLQWSSKSPRQLSTSRALLLPMTAGRMPILGLRLRHLHATQLTAELRVCSRRASYTPDVILDQIEVSLPVAASTRREDAVKDQDSQASLTLSQTDEFVTATKSQSNGLTAQLDSLAEGNGYPISDEWKDVEIELEFDAELESDCYVFVCLQANPLVEVYESQQLVTGITTVSNRQNAKVAKGRGQMPPQGSGIDTFELWPAERRPNSRNLAVTADLAASTFAPQNVINGFARPTSRANAWIASPEDPLPTLTMSWNEPQQIRTIELVFDPDWDHPMENIVMQHSERIMPTLVRSFRILGPDQKVLASGSENHQAVVTCHLPSEITVDRLYIELDQPSDEAPTSLFEVRCYADTDETGKCSPPTES